MGTTIRAPARAKAKRIVQRALLASPFSRIFNPPHPRPNLSMPELAALGNALETTAHVDGCILEVGCHAGHTTVFVNDWMDAIGMEKPYIGIDTFAGFTEEDIEADEQREIWGKRSPLRGQFRTVTQEAFDHRMKVNGVKRVRSVRADANTLDYSQFAPISFAFVDTDLYRPVMAALRGVYPALAPGGLIVVDDVGASPFRGARDAYEEFCQEHGLPEQCEREKLGLIRKPAGA